MDTYSGSNGEKTAPHRLGLALSGGGFRATLYHLGVVRFLRDAGLLDLVTHITSVSGGSILAAHLVLNWERYAGDEEAFDEAAREVLDVVRLDVRNRILRRFPFGAVYNAVRFVLRQGTKRRATRTGLLEGCYEERLYGDTCLFDLPVRPELHILATNLNDGCLCSFTRDGMFLLRNDGRGRMVLEPHHVGLATVPIAVAASSAFPGFFPPLELDASEVGADQGEFQTQRFTDGGVYDNLGIRMFLALDRSRRESTVLTRESFVDVRAAMRALNAGARASERTPIRRLAEIYAREVHGKSSPPQSQPLVDEAEALIHGLDKIVTSVDLRQDPVLGPLRGESGAEESEESDRARSNRRRIDAALRSAASPAALRSPGALVDLVIASDAGKKSSAQRGGGSGTLIGTAIRASDILMDRVWQLETESFSEREGVVFTPVTDVVESDEDPTAMHPEVQRQTTRMRTDLDRFSDLECSALIRHGYCVARKRLRPHLEREGIEVPEKAPWNPIADVDEGLEPERPGAGVPASTVVAHARTLQKGAERHIWSRVFDRRDWVSYVYLPLFALVLVGLPLYLHGLYQEAERGQILTDAVSQANPDFKRILELLRDGQPREWIATQHDEVSVLEEPPGIEVFEVISNTRIVDLTNVTTAQGAQNEATGSAYVYRRLVVRKKLHDRAQTSLRLRLASRTPELRCSSPDRVPVLRRPSRPAIAKDGEEIWYWELELNLADARIGDAVTLEIDGFDPRQLHRTGKEWVHFPVSQGADFAAMWILLPEGQTVEDFDVVSYEPDDRDGAEIVEPTSQVTLYGGRVIHWTVIDPDETREYECRFHWK